MAAGKIRDKRSKMKAAHGRLTDTPRVIVFGNMTYFSQLFAKTACGRRQGRRRNRVGGRGLVGLPE